jgi:serine/threonine protein kinase
MLARKTIRRNFRLNREDAIDEVAHLQRLSHSHIVRSVGTYVIGKKLSVVLYPATSHNLEKFLGKVNDLDSKWLPSSPTICDDHMCRELRRYFQCLSSTVAFPHKKIVKHMDIKPTNILIQEQIPSKYVEHKLHLAYFGISRSYDNMADVKTDSRIPFSKANAAPEVVRQDTRGFPVDTFSLGCVFLEMVAVLAKKRDALFEVQRANSTGDTSYQANTSALQCEIFSDQGREWMRKAIVDGLDGSVILVQAIEQTLDVSDFASYVCPSISYAPWRVIVLSGWTGAL